MHPRGVLQDTKSPGPAKQFVDPEESAFKEGIGSGPALALALRRRCRARCAPGGPVVGLQVCTF